MQQSLTNSQLLTSLQPIHTQYTKYVLQNAGLYGYKPDSTVPIPTINHIPFAGLPYSLPRSHYHALLSTQPIWSKLFVKLSLDKPFLNEMLTKTSAHDPLIKQLLNVLNTTQNPQPIQMNIPRNDYMLDHEKGKYLMVEYNLIAVSLVYISDKLQEVQKELLTGRFPQRYGRDGFVESKNTEVVCDGMVKAIELAGLTGIVIMIVQQNETNVFDQGLIEWEMLKRGRFVVRATLQELVDNLALNPDTLLPVYLNQPVALFYFRDGYIPQNYTSPSFWQLRATIQKSTAVKIPTIGMQLVNSKRIQQQLYSRQTLTKYLTQQESSALLNQMAAMYNFETPETFGKLKEMDLERIILKPNRDGGGNNFFGKDALVELERLGEEERCQYILMEKIGGGEGKGEKVKNLFFRKGEGKEEGETLAEVSMNSVVVYEGDKVVSERFAGCMVRTKALGVNEGGVAAQAAVLTGLYLEDDGKKE